MIPGLEQEFAAGLEVLEELGRGAQTVVYRARRGEDDYAVKLLHSTDTTEERTLAAFRREAALLACVDHPGLPRVFEVGQASGRPYLVLELIHGRRLSDFLLDGPMDESRLLRLGNDVAGALAAAHRAGLVHRDVKPDNIMIGPDGAARLIDFGLATQGGGDREEIVGTLQYSAPEQSGMLKRQVDGRADLYALGVVLFECATGAPPFTSSDAGELIRLHATAPAPDVRSLRPEVSPAMAAVIARLLAKDPDDRFQTAHGLLFELRRLLDQPDPDVPQSGLDRAAAAAESPLVGRGQEYAQLAARWRQARSGQGGIVLLQGPPGTGKSRLARELTAAAHADGRLVLHGKCSPDDPVPLAPLRAAVDRYLHDVGQLAEADAAAATARLRAAAADTAGLLKPLSPALAAVLEAPDLDAQDRHDQFTSAVAAFLAALATAAGGAVLHIDDVQWLDGASRRVLQELAPHLPGVPLLLVATARDDADSVGALAAFRTEHGALIDPHLTLAPLDGQATAQLVAAQLGGGGVVDHALTAALTRRTGGNPFAVQEYVRAALDAGLLRPSWGSWVLDTEGVDRLELSGDALALVLRRIDGIGDTARQLLVAAAAAGMRFQPGLLGEVTGLDERRLLDIVGDATSRRLIEPRDGGEYAFLHDRIREALLAEVEPARLRRLHQRIAEALDTTDPATDPTSGAERTYAAARHYTLGETDRRPDRAYAACAAAGTLALADHAPVEALAFLEQAAALADGAGVTPDGHFHQSLGLALARNGRFGEARQSLARALDGEPDRQRRAELRGLIAEVHLSAWEPEQALAAVTEALREFGRPLPRNRLLLVVTTVLSFLAGLVVGRTRIGFGTATGDPRERYRLQASLYDIGAYAAAIAFRYPLQATFMFRSLYPINRIGPTPEYVRRIAGFGVMANMMRRHRTADRIFTHAEAVAAELGDPTLVAHAEWKRAAGAYMGGVDTGESFARVLEERGRWLDLGDYLNGVATWCAQLALRGKTRETEAWYQRARARLSRGAQAEGSALTAIGIVLPAQAGRPAEAAGRLRPVRAFVEANPVNFGQRLNMICALMYLALEQGDHGAPFSEALDELEQLQLKPAAVLNEQRVVYVHRANGWLARLADAAPADRAEVRGAAAAAVADLGRAACTDLLRGYHRAARASLAQLTGEADDALALLRAADQLAERLDAPLLAYEIARVRARTLRALGQPGAADRQAGFALLLATQQGWPHRARWIRAEFGLVDSVTPVYHGKPGEGGGSHVLHGRRLQALQQVSLAAVTVLDPSELARVALDEIVRILGAERAFLFLPDPDRDLLVPHLGRDAEGREIAELTGYSATLVERVRDTREALVVTGSEEGAALGSQSAVVHGLRSIMIAPLLLDERLLGIVYLDSRVAKGIFTRDDVDILAAITNHVAVSLETARAAQLELAVQAAGRQRDMAETLRAAMAELSAILDPAEVMQRLLETVSRVLPGEVAVLLRLDGDRIRLSAVHGATPAGITAGMTLSAAADPVLAGLFELTGPVTGTVAPGQPAPAREVLGAVRCWLAVPAAEPDGRPGVMLVGSALADQVTPAQEELAATLAGQGMVAYENAHLFTQVQRMATVDGLTELNNRTHFFHLAGQQVEAAQQLRRPVAAIMLDIDHFKRINDRYGHAVGDVVLRAVAARLRLAARETDVLGRYGGEEFALVAPETGPGAVELAERLREAVAGEPVPTAAGPLSVTISVGVTHEDPAASGLDDLLARADTALYDAKQRGRDRVVATG